MIKSNMLDKINVIEEMGQLALYDQNVEYGTDGVQFVVYNNKLWRAEKLVADMTPNTPPSLGDDWANVSDGLKHNLQTITLTHNMDLTQPYKLEIPMRDGGSLDTVLTYVDDTSVSQTETVSVGSNALLPDIDCSTGTTDGNGRTMGLEIFVNGVKVPTTAYKTDVSTPEANKLILDNFLLKTIAGNNQLDSGTDLDISFLGV